jgi:AraC-like DNA-binding protein
MKYIRFIPAFLLGAMLMACNTPKKLYEAQEYDQVIQRFAPDICGGDMNAKRINYVTRQLREHPGLDIQTAFFNAGYRSRATAWRNFKEIVGVTPTEYRQQLFP